MPYVETWFDAIDYIDEITTDQLEKELRQRGQTIGEKVIDVIKDELTQAWDCGDEVAFQRAIAMIENPENERKKQARIERKYMDFIALKQTNAKA